MLVENSTHGVKKVLERCIGIVILKFKNMGPIYCKIVKNEIFTIKFRPITFKMLDFFLRAFEKMWCALRNCGK